MTTVLVTGAGGLLGSHLIALLTRRPDYRIVASTSRAPDSIRALWVERGALLGNISNIEIVRAADVVNYTSRVAVDWLVNCSFPRNLGGSELARGLEFHDELFTSAARGGVGAVVNVSSQSVYPSSRSYAADERSDVDLDTPYATAKYATELMLRAAFRDRPYTNARLASLIAPGFDQRVVNKLVKRALSGDPLHITAGNQVFDFMDVKDAARALDAVITTGIVQGTQILNVGSGQPVSLASLAQEVVDVVADRVSFSIDLSIQEQAEGASSSALDSRLLMKSYGFIPSVSVRESIHNIARESSATRQRRIE